MPPKVEVVVSKRKPRSRGQAKGPVRPSRTKQKVGRRRVGKIGIQFFDLGRLADGSTLFHQAIKTDRTFPSPTELETVHDALQSDLLTGANVFTRFKKITKTDFAGNVLTIRFMDGVTEVFDHPANITQWVGDTLSIDQAGADSLYAFDNGGPMYRAFDPQGDVFSVKVTALPSVAAPEVPFNASRAMQIGIVPAIAGQTPEVDGASAGDNLILNGFASIIPRNFPSAYPESASITYESSYRWWEILKTGAGARAFRNVFGFPLVSLSDFPGTDFPAPPGSPTPGSVVADFGIGNLSSYWVNRLMSIVKSGGATYYIWNI